MHYLDVFNASVAILPEACSMSKALAVCLTDVIDVLCSTPNGLVHQTGFLGTFFHKFVIIAATRDMARKVLNSPTYVKPCVVDAAHKLLRPENWVFLDGKEHVEYRRGLNSLFTRKALGCVSSPIDLCFPRVMCP